MERSIVVFNGLKALGAAYLVWLGVQVAARTRRWRKAAEDVSARSPSLLRLGRQGFIVGVADPKGFLLFVAVLPQFVDPAAVAVPLQMLLLGSLCVMTALVTDSVWALAAGSARAWFARSPRRLARVGAAGGLVTIGLGVRLALARQPG